jgi:hypothetical protein
MQSAREAERKPRQYPKGKILFGVCLVALIIVGYGVWQYTQLPSTNGSGTEGLAPSFSMKDINGTQFSFNQYSGKVIAIHFMAVDCNGEIDPTNDQQLTQLKTVCNKYCGNKPVTVVTVAIATCQSWNLTLAQIRHYYNITWVLGNDFDDGKMDIVNAYTEYSIGDGTIVLIDKTFNVAQVYTDAITADTLSLKINQLLGA